MHGSRKPYAADLRAVRGYARRHGILSKHVQVSDRSKKKVKVWFHDEGWVHAGHTGYQNYTTHKDRRRRSRYLSRARGMPHPRGSPNWVAIKLLWGG